MLKSKEPFHGTRNMPSLGKPFRMSCESGLAGYGKHQREQTDKTNARTYPQQNLLNENGRGKQYFFFYLYKTDTRNQARKQIASDVCEPYLLVIMFETMETTGMEQDENRHNPGIAHTTGVVTWIFI